MGIEKGLFQRTELLIGSERMERIARARVIIFGAGGVGSWCAESLVRTGIRRLDIVDSDRICVTNINRQLMAATSTVGQVKVEALRRRLLDINPKAEINAIQKIYDADTAGSFNLADYRCIIDAIDSLSCKALLLRNAALSPAAFFSSMGAALKADPTRIKVAEFRQVKGCPLAAALRRKFRQTEFPARKFLCVYSDELLVNQGQNASCGTDRCLCPKALAGPGDPNLVNHEWCSMKAQINGTLAHITAIFGFMLAGLAVEELIKDEN
ncbi:MAG: tRNA threonylcarbamoyladenosine dehydratase [Tannerellaceae bacterium]|jgi:tRNA A37 threonylcarbamoyladenosine dehydratase|nr:tRNA threonylcarbamoyladenosine dehydratase [Tannerellaceae bacterium]